MTYHAKSEFMRVMLERGFVADCTDYQALDEALIKGVVPAYIGFDATAKSLHVGSLIQIMMLRWLQKTGHKPIVLMGGGTTKVGDPSFRADERPLLDDAAINDNIAGIKAAFASYVNFGDGPTDAEMVNNAEWLDGLNYLSFLRDIGRHFSVNRMLAFESVKSRLDREQSLSFLEFNYMILQAYDFLELNRRYGCLSQMGGSDQWGNIVNGIDLTRRCWTPNIRTDTPFWNIGRQKWAIPDARLVNLNWQPIICICATRSVLPSELNRVDGMTVRPKVETANVA